MQKTTHEGLIRGIRRWDLVALTINGIIGAGIFGLPSKVYSLIGTYSLFAFVACALVVALIVLCFSEVGSRFDETGGPYLYAKKALGPTIGFEIGWLMWLARLTAFAANCNLLVSYLSYFWVSATSSFWRPVLITSVVTVLSIVNILGVRQAALVSNGFTIGKLVPIIIFICAGLFFVKPEAYVFAAPPSNGAFSQSVLLLIYAFTGFEMSSVPAGEVRNPQTELPRALLIALLVVASLYMLIQIVCVGTLPELAQSTKPLADAGSRFLGNWGGAIISAGAIISIVGNLNVLVLAGSRIGFAMAEQKELPAIIGQLHKRYATPYISILFTTVVMLVMTLKSSFVAALTISAIARLVTYAATCLALPVLRRSKNTPRELFHLRGGGIVATLSLLLIIWLLANSTRQEATTTLIAAVVGLLIYLTYRLYSRLS